MSAVSGAEVFAFEGFSLDSRQRLLFGPDGRSLPLKGRAFDTLLYLVEHPNQLIDKQALMKAVWPNVVVEENNLNQNILLVRRALGETPGENRFIVTVPGRGFRFVPPVRRLEGAGAFASDAKAASTTTAVLAAAPMEANANEPAVPGESTSSAAHTAARVGRPRFAARISIAVLAVAALLIGIYWRERSGTGHTSGSIVPSQSRSSTDVAPARAGDFAPPPHSIAVLPFLNLSGDKEQDYFSDGLTEELLNSLSHISELQVAGRTSSFYFKGEHADLATIAHKLNVGTVLEGSVRRSGHTIRVTTQLINAVTGFHQWSETYDRDLGDVLQLQTEIATAVAGSLKVALLGDEAAKIEVGGTHNPAAFDAYLRATATYWGGASPQIVATATADYTEAIRLDPNYALAYAARALAFTGNSILWDTTMSAVRADLDKAQGDAAKAIALAPDLSEGYLARAVINAIRLEFKEAGENYKHALAIAPGNARVLRDSGGFAVAMGHGDSGLASVRRAVVLDPLNSNSHGYLGTALQNLRRYPEALTVFKEAEALPSTTPGPYLGEIGTAYYLLGDFARARVTCEQFRDDRSSQLCLALAYDRLGRHADAEAELKRIQTTRGDTGTYTCAQIYAQWGNRPKALEWLNTAMRSRNPALQALKTDPLLDPLRNEPGFQAIERELKFRD